MYNNFFEPFHRRAGIYYMNAIMSKLQYLKTTIIKLNNSFMIVSKYDWIDR